MQATAEKRPFIIADLKSAIQSEKEVIEWANSLVILLGDNRQIQERLQLIACFPPLYLLTAARILSGMDHPVEVGAQGVDTLPHGNNTVNATSVDSLKNDGVKYLILNHPQNVSGRDGLNLAALKMSLVKAAEITPITFVTNEYGVIGLQESLGEELTGLIAHERFAEDGKSPLVPHLAGAAATALFVIANLPVLHVGGVSFDNIGEYLAQDNISGVVLGAKSADIPGFLAPTLLNALSA